MSMNTGGAVGIRSGSADSSVAIFTDNSFTNNTANLHGGAMCIDTATITFTGTNRFTDNYAGLYGGAVCTISGSVTFNDTNIFVGNVAGGSNAVGGGYLLTMETT